MASYYVWSGATGSANGTTWANAYTTLTLAFSGKAAGDVFYVAHDHAETSASTVTYNSQGSITNPCKVVCVNRAGSVPPVTADKRTTATCTTTGTGAITFASSLSVTHYDGIIFTAGSGANSVNISVGPQNGAAVRFDNCSLRLGSTLTGCVIQFGSSGAAPQVDLNNTTLSFGNVGQSINYWGILRWRNTPSALLGSMPTTLFSQINNRGGTIECIGVDLSASGSGNTLFSVNAAFAQIVRVADCKLNSAVTKASLPASLPGAAEFDFVRSGTTNYAVYRNRIPGVLTEETTIVRTGGASDGTTTISWKVVTTANCNYSQPFECPPIAIWNDTTGSAKTATIEGIWGGGAVPNDDDVWVDVEFGDASSQWSFVNDARDILGTAAGQTASTAIWGGSTTKFKLEVTFTPQQRGWIYCRVKCAAPSATFYIDPLVTLS